MQVMDNRAPIELVGNRRLPGAIAQTSHGSAHSLLFFPRKRAIEAGHRISCQINLASRGQQAIAHPIIVNRAQVHRPLQIRKCQQRLLMARTFRPASKILDVTKGVIYRMVETDTGSSKILIMRGTRFKALPYDIATLAAVDQRQYSNSPFVYSL